MKLDFKFIGAFLGLMILIGIFFWIEFPSNKVSEIKEEVVILEAVKANPSIIKEESFNLEKAFDGNIPQDENIWTLAVTGDVMLGRTVNYKTILYKDYQWAFKNISGILKSADLSLINLENPLVENCPIKNDGMIFCASTKHTEGLVFAGIDAASLANNHSMNYGIDGLKDTVRSLRQNNIAITGISEPALLKIKDKEVAILSYDDIECFSQNIACINEEKIKTEISLAKQKSDLVIAMFHWGNEYTYQPTSRQKMFAYLSIDAGADLVVGNHPHWYQPLEIYKDKAIMYSHGNTIFDQMWSRQTREGVIGRYFFNGNELVDIEFIPTLIEDYGQPRILENEESKNVLENLRKISLQFQS